MTYGRDPTPYAGSPVGLVEGKGIYCYTWEPRDYDGVSLGRVFDLYAAPTDLRELEAYSASEFPYLIKCQKALEYLPTLRNWNGHDGAKIAVHPAGNGPASIMDVVRNNPESLSGWFMPTPEIFEKNLRGSNQYFPKSNQMSSRDRQYYLTSRIVLGNHGELNAIAYGMGEGYSVNLFQTSSSYGRVRPVRAELRQP